MTTPTPTTPTTRPTTTGAVALEYLEQLWGIEPLDVAQLPNGADALADLRALIAERDAAQATIAELVAALAGMVECEYGTDAALKATQGARRILAALARAREAGK